MKLKAREILGIKQRLKDIRLSRSEKMRIDLTYQIEKFLNDKENETKKIKCCGCGGCQIKKK